MLINIEEENSVDKRSSDNAEKVTVNEYYGNDYSRTYQAVLEDGKLIEVKEEAHRNEKINK